MKDLTKGNITKLIISFSLPLLFGNVFQLLYNLALEHVIRYVPCDRATVLFLHHDRLRPKNVNLDPERYEMLKNSALSRMQKMIDYVSQEEVCRSSYLLEYFGQKDSRDCRTCDVCRAAASVD